MRLLAQSTSGTVRTSHVGWLNFKFPAKLWILFSVKLRSGQRTNRKMWAVTDVFIHLDPLR